MLVYLFIVCVCVHSKARRENPEGGIINGVSGRSKQLAGPRLAD